MTGIADAVSAAVENLVLLENPQREGIDERILRIAFRKGHFAADRGHAETVSVKCDAADHAFHDVPVLRGLQWAESQAVHGRQWDAHPL